MITVFLSILKIIGIVLLCILLFVLAAALLILFVPVRYQLKGCRLEEDDVPIRASVKITWLLHVVNASFRYPEEAYVKIRIFCFTVFSTMKEKTKQYSKKDNKIKKQPSKEGKSGAAPKEMTTESKKIQEEGDFSKQETEEERKAVKQEEVFEEPLQEEEVCFTKFLKKLFHILKNIKYTINQIYDKIKHIISNIRYYIGIIESDSFKKAWQLCENQAISLIKTILPRKIKGNFVIGTNDPASTARILAIQGILYPIIGNHILITPDFDRSIIAGDFSIKGKITVFKVLKTALKIYFNKDLRRVIRLFKKEAA